MGWSTPLKTRAKRGRRARKRSVGRTITKTARAPRRSRRSVGRAISTTPHSKHTTFSTPRGKSVGKTVAKTGRKEQKRQRRRQAARAKRRGRSVGFAVAHARRTALFGDSPDFGDSQVKQDHDDGLSLSDVGSFAGPLLPLKGAKALFNVGRATAEDPGAVASSSVRTGIESIAGIPQGVKMLVEDPEKAIKAIAGDYKKRYGPLLEGDDKTFRERLKKDYGITPYALDAAAAAGGGGQAAGALSRTRAVGKIADELAKQGDHGAARVARHIHEATTKERPRLRIAGGETGSVKQHTSSNLFVAATQHALDRKRGRAFEKEAEGVGLKAHPDGRLERVKDAKPGRLRAVRPGKHEVLPYFSARESKLIRRYAGRTERRHGERKGKERIALLTHGGGVEKRTRKLIRSLDKNEKESLKYVLTLGLTHRNLDAAVEALRRYRDTIKGHRKTEGEVLPFGPDELPTIERILADPQAHITERVRAVADELRAIEHGEAAKDPDLVSTQAADRRVAPVSMVLGERRAPDAGELHGRIQGIEQQVRGGGPAWSSDAVTRHGHIGHIPPEERLGAVKHQDRLARKARGHAERAHVTAERQAARVRAIRQERDQRGPALETQQVREARAELSSAKRERRRLRKGHAAQEYRTGRVHGRSEAVGRREVAKLEKEAERLRGVVTGHVKRGETAKAAKRLEEIQALEERIKQGAPEPTLRAAERAGASSVGRRAELERAERRVTEARAKLDDHLERAPRVSDALAKRERRAEENVVHKRAARDDARIQHEITARLRKEVKNRPGRYESSKAWQARMDKAITAAGLEAPGYFESTGGAELRRSLHAIGSGMKGAARSKQYTGKRFLAGREANDPEVIVNGLLRNAKRRFSWRYTINTVNHAAFEWSRGPHGGGLTAKQIAAELERRHIDPDQVEYVNVRVLEKRELDDEGLGRGRVDDPAEDASPHGGIHPDDLAHVADGLDAARTSRDHLLAEAHDVTPEGVRGQAMNRYVAIDSRDYAELASTLSPDGVVGRAIDILWKQKPARILLGLANTSWLSFQAMANGVLTGIAGVNPFDYVVAQRWFKKLSEEERLAIEPELGITHNFHHIGEQTHLGAATNARFVNAWRAFKQTKVMRTAHKGNPLDLMFRADEAQNNFFRKALFYNRAKREAYKRMGANWTTAAGLEHKITSIFSLRDPESRIKALTENADTLDEHAKAVKEWLGDYVTYTSHERRTIARSVMFYGYLRHSLRLVFWTMPVKHPVTTAILTDIGRMGAQEVKHLLGVPPSERVPTNMLAQAYFGTAAEIQSQKPGSGTINFGRMNPLLNAFTQMEQPEQIAGLFSPVFQAEVDQLFHTSTFTGRTWRVGGKPTPSESERPQDFFGSFFSQLDPSIPNPARLIGLGPKELHVGSARGRILERQLLSLAQPFQIAEDLTLRGSQSDDSLPWHPLPMQYKDPKAKAGTERQRRAQEAQGIAKPLARRLFPLLGLTGIGPQPTSASIILKREREKRAATKKSRKKKRKGGGGGGGGGVSLGGSSGGGGGGIALGPG